MLAKRSWLPGRVRWRGGSSLRSMACQVGQVDKLQPRLIAQKARHRQQIAGAHREIDLAVGALHIHQLRRGSAP
jgi:hypothetical protein